MPANFLAKIVRRYCQIKCMVLLLGLCTLNLTAYADSKAFNLLNASIAELQTALDKGDITSVELVEHYLTRIDAYDQQHTQLNAILRINPKALEQAAALDLERKQKGSRGPLHGIPMVLKDNYNTADLATSAGSVAFAGFIPPADAFQVNKLRQAGAIILAKTNMDELAAGIKGLSALGGQTKNPYDLTRNPGGSSSGTAVAVAAQFAAVGMGTDTCGSITMPSSFNNLVGLRPSKGLTSISGIIPLFSFTDVGGPMAQSVEDAAIMMDILVDQDTKVPTTKKRVGHPNFGFVEGLKGTELSGLRFGRLTNYFDESPSSQVNTVIADTIEVVKKQGGTIVNIDTTLFDTILADISWKPQNRSSKAEMAYYLQSYPGSGFKSINSVIAQGLYLETFDDFKPPIREAILFPEITEQEIRIRSAKVELLNKAIEQVMLTDNLDALIYPSAKVIPAKLGASQEGYTCSLGAFSGTPVLALPVGFTPSGLPIGVSLLALRFNDKKLLAIGYAMEQAIKPTIDVPALPLTTPPLVNGQAPESIAFTIALDNIAEVDLVYNPMQSTLQYQTQVKRGQEIDALCLHKSKQGAVIQCLYGPQGRRSTGKVVLSYQHIQALKNNQLYLRVYSQASPMGQQSQQVIFPK